jgi:hypothetical protein
MQLYKVRGGTEKDLYAKQYNIGVGISLFSPEAFLLFSGGPASGETK